MQNKLFFVHFRRLSVINDNFIHCIAFRIFYNVRHSFNENLFMFLKTLKSYVNCKISIHSWVEVCQFGKNCKCGYFPHRLVFSHPGDHDYYLTDTAALNSRPECEFGVLCYRKNPEHLKKLKHSRKPEIWM